MDDTVKTIFSHDFGSANYGYAITKVKIDGQKVLFRIIENGLCPSTIRDLSSTKHKQIAQEQIKRLMSRNKEKIKEPLKYEQKLFRMFLNGTLIYDKDLQLIIDELDAKIFADIGKK